jgi:hypothetical protein
VKEKDANKGGLERVEKANESEPVKGEDLVKSEDLKRKLVDSKKRITDDNTSRPQIVVPSAIAIASSSPN